MRNILPRYMSCYSVWYSGVSVRLGTSAEASGTSPSSLGLSQSVSAGFVERLLQARCSLITSCLLSHWLPVTTTYKPISLISSRWGNGGLEMKFSRSKATELRPWAMLIDSQVPAPNHSLFCLLELPSQEHARAANRAYRCPDKALALSESVSLCM